MSGWPGKYVIGLTGNIATGKSVVRRMLEHLGAYGIDADFLAHKVIMKGSPGYEPVVETFGKWILTSDAEVDRSRLGRIVFTDSFALEKLEAIIHPFVSMAVDILVAKSSCRVIVIEAIKLLESGLSDQCDSIWTTYSSREFQIARLIEKRGMSEAEAALRVDTQPAQDIKIRSASVIIRNDGTFDDMWKQVYDAWQKTIPVDAKMIILDKEMSGEYNVQRAKPDEIEQVASLINRLSEGEQSPDTQQIMGAFREKAFLFLLSKGEQCGILSWQVENLVVRVDNVFVDKNLPLHTAMTLLLNEVEKASSELNCEISLLFLPQKYLGCDEIFNSLGYSAQPIGNLGVPAWEEAVRESMPEKSFVLFKQLRDDQVLEPV